MNRLVIGTAVGLIVFGIFQIHGTAWQEPSLDVQQEMAEAFTAPPDADAANWMEAMLPAVDPGHLGHWIFERNGSWGATDNSATVWIDPDMPVDKRYSVMIHEYAHVLQVQQFGSLDAARAVEDIESAADCYALDHNATWINYGCDR